MKKGNGKIIEYITPYSTLGNKHITSRRTINIRNKKGDFDMLLLSTQFTYYNIPSLFLYIILLPYLMLLFRFVCSFTTPVRVIFIYHIWYINKPSYPILSYISIIICVILMSTNII